jgi:hypothetical protein
MTAGRTVLRDRAIRPARVGVRSSPTRHLPFAALALAGLLLRVAAIVADRPALMLYGDSYSYLANAAHLTPNAFHPIVYPLFLRALSWTGNVAAVAAVQHLLGLLLAVALYLALLRLAVRPWLAALACAPLLLDAYQVFAEQTVVSEALFEVLLTGALLLVVTRRARRPAVALVAAVALLVAAATLTRGLAAAAVAPAVLVYFAVRRPGWLRAAVFVAVLAAPLLLYALWFRASSGQFTLESYTGRLFYGRVESFAYQHCAQLDPLLPADERVLCDPRLGADPKLAGVPTDDGVNFYAWSPTSPFYRLHPPAGTTQDQLAEDYAKRVAAAEPGAFGWTTLVNLAHFFAPTRAGVNPQAPIAEWQFQRRTDPAALHMLLGKNTFGQSGQPNEPSQPAHWPAGWLAAYQRFGFTPGPLLLGCLLLVAVSLVLRGGGEPAGRQRAAALLFGLSGLLLLVVPAALTGDEPRYLLPTLPLIPPAGALAAQAILARRATPR